MGLELNKYNERKINGLEAFDEVKMLIVIGDVVQQWLYFDRSVTEQIAFGWGGSNYNAIASFKCDLDAGIIGVKVRNTTGWNANITGIKQIRTVKRK